MIKSSTATHDFAYTSNDVPMFSVHEGIPLADALGQAIEYLKGANASNDELVENIPVHMRALSSAVGRSIETARALIEASIAGLEERALGSESD